MEAAVIRRTQDTLGKVIRKPPLTDKLLAKPPFRYLHDILTEVIRTTSFLKGLYTESDLKSDNVKDKDSKISFLQKAIDVVGLVIGEPLSVKPARIVAGHEPEKTNEFLQALGKCCLNKLSSDDAVKRVLTGEKLEPKGKPSSSTKSQDKENREAKDEERRSQREKEDRKESEIRERSGSKDRKDRQQLKDEEKKHSEREKKKERERVGETEKDGLREGEKNDREKSRIKESRSETDKDRNKEKGGDRERRSEGSHGKERDRTRDKEKVRGREREHEKERNLEKEKDPEDRSRETDRDRGDRNRDERTRTREQDKERRRERDPERRKERVRENEQQGDRKEKPEEARSERKLSVSSKASRPSASKLRERRPAKLSGEGENKLFSESTALPSEDYRKQPPSLCPTMYCRRIPRPGSARPAPPRVKRQPSTDVIVPERASSGKGVSSVIVEKQKDNGGDDDDDNEFVVEEASPQLSDMPAMEMVRKLDGPASEKHGSLVKKILETKKDYETQADAVSKDKTLLTDNGRKKEKDMVTKEIEKFRSSIQIVCRSALPLGKIMDYIQEDMDTMQNELQTWRKENGEHAEVLLREQSITDSAVEPLKAELAELEQLIKEQRDRICTVKGNILRNEEKIQKMVQSMSGSSID
ncbi:PREDICTED: TRAF3-interacting protein 1 [Nanorana parkeri]|uniref:TRAF3-interacting protein 1 n=1 Tax=Nanorana parkeri TaxID=125878 RepID=UPI0008544D7E|nr:PREDICTED: TRAF3-interacting protein 1 [Nanorana parkeri]